MKICICIPCVDKHIVHLNNLLTSFEKFTRQPDEIMISLSPKFNNFDLNKKKEELLEKFPNKNLKILVQNKETNAATHLNIMAEKVESDIIVRSDADDTMHPQKIEVVHHIFTKYPNTKLLLHRWLTVTQNRNYELTNYSKIDINNIEIFDDVKIAKGIDIMSLNFSKK